MRDWVNKIHCIDWIEGFKSLPDGSVDMIITSPPYWGLRDYGLEPIVFDGLPGCEHEWGKDLKRRLRGSVTESAQVGSHKNERQGREVNQGNFCLECGAWRGQLGLEPNPGLYIQHLMQGFIEAMRVLKPTGTCWVNLGDTYWSAKGDCFNPGGGNESWQKWNNKTIYNLSRGNKSDCPELRPKSKAAIPERFVLAMLSQGWIYRNEIPWYKPNSMPSSAKDRFTNTWEPVFFFTKEEKYFFDLDAVREKHKAESLERVGRKWDGHREPMSAYHGMNIEKMCHSAGKNPGDLWEIPTQPFPEAHFATFPEALLVKPIKAGCPQWICKKCGKIRERITEPTEEYAKLLGKGFHDHSHDETKGMSQKKQVPSVSASYKTIGFTDCGCNVGWEGGVVLDPFMGSGTTAVVARKQSRNYIGFELNPEYIKIANTRLAQGVLF